MAKDLPKHGGITMHGIKVGANVPGVIFTVASMLIFLLGVPAFRVFLALSLAVAWGVVLLLQRVHRDLPGDGRVLKLPR